jgi:hypothetical protein
MIVLDLEFDLLALLNQESLILSLTVLKYTEAVTWCVSTPVSLPAPHSTTAKSGFFRNSAFGSTWN